MVKRKASRGSGAQRGKGICVGVLAVTGLSSLACSTQYVERGPVSAAQSQREYLAPESTGPLLVSQANRGDELSLQLQPAQCLTRFFEQPVARETLLKKSTFLGGPGLVLGGLALGGIGTAGFIASHDSPESCAEGEDDCVSRDEARGLSVVAWGLGAAGVAVGVYRAFKAPVELGQRSVPVAEATFTDQRGPCRVPIAGVRARLDLSTGASAARVTDSDGRLYFRLDGDQLPIGSTGTLLVADQRFTIDLSDIARAEPPPPPPAPAEREACDFSDLPPPRTGFQQATQLFVEGGVCKALLIKATDKGIDWGSDKAADRVVEDMDDGWLKEAVRMTLSEFFKAGASAMVADQTPRGAEIVCCLLERKIRNPDR
jgi:hypothetical protein